MQIEVNVRCYAPNFPAAFNFSNIPMKGLLFATFSGCERDGFNGGDHDKIKCDKL
jgi:hypothetical protein